MCADLDVGDGQYINIKVRLQSIQTGRRQLSALGFLRHEMRISGSLRRIEPFLRSYADIQPTTRWLLREPAVLEALQSCQIQCVVVGRSASIACSIGKVVPDTD